MGGWVDLGMIRCLLMLFIGLASIGCNRKNMKKGIYEQGNYINEKNDIINTFYIYDFVPEETIKMHAMKSEHTIGSRTANYYFSYNANIPNQALVLAESLSEANKLIDDYSYGIKYAFIRNQAGEIKFVNCSESPDDELCTPD